MKQKLEAIMQTEAKTVGPCPIEMQAKADARQVGQFVARHGDLWLYKVAVVPVGAKRLDAREILRSSTTGHVHGVRGRVAIYEGESAVKEAGRVHYLVVDGPAEMALHLEHKDRPLPVGVWEVRRSREGRSESWRRVMD